MLRDYDLTLVQQIELAPTIFEMTLQGDLGKVPITAGQFVNVKIPDDRYLLRRPFAIAETNPQAATIKLTYRVVGDGTEILAGLKVGTHLSVLGPLGHGFPMDFLSSGNSALVIGGGTGTPPAYELTRQLHALGVQVDIALGFPTKGRIFYEQDFAQFGTTKVSTDDGSYGLKGNIIDLIKQNFDHNYQAVYACGPRGLEIAVSKYFKGHPHAYISAEARMACGVGICNACVLHTVSDPQGPSEKRVCYDGPVFKINEVII